VTDSRDPAPVTRPLAPLDISEVEEQAYRELLGRPAATVAELSSALGMSTRRIQRLLDVLEAKGLATHTPQRPRRYIPAAPDLAIERLIMQRQEELERARSVIGDLHVVGESARSGGVPDRFVEIISSREAERQVLEDSIRAARESVLSLVRLPVRVSRLDIPRNQDQRFQLQARDRGVRFRTVVDADFLELPGAADAVRADIQTGEEVRVAGELPVKLVIVDTRVACSHLTCTGPTAPRFSYGHRLFLMRCGCCTSRSGSEPRRCRSATRACRTTRTRPHASRPQMSWYACSRRG
jgi:sugar-specific transcriptional regulator TrmB